MVRLLYETSVTYRGYLIIPFVGGSIAGEEIYSYVLPSELGHGGQFHREANPSEEFSGRVEDLVKIAQAHLAQYLEIDDIDYFKHRYNYRNSLIIVLRKGRKVFGVAGCKYELPSSRSGARASPTLLPGEKGARSLVPSPFGRGLG